MTAVAVVGSANLDLVVRVSRRPEPGETVLGDGYEEHPGGKGANQALAAARVAATSFVGARGDDAAGDLLAAELSRAGVDIAHLSTVDGPTGRAFIQLTPDGENSIVVLAGANARLTPDRVTAALDRLRPLVVLTQLEIPAEATAAVAAWVRATGSRLVLNASPVAPVPAEVLELADPLIVNAAEAWELLRRPIGGRDEASVAEVARAFGYQTRSVIVTDGGRGAHVAAGDRDERVPAEAATVVDTTGAGDAFAGTLAGRLALGAELGEAARLASQAAARLVSRPRADRV